MKTNILNIKKIIKNNFYIMRTVCHVDGRYVGFTLLVRMVSAICNSFLYVYLLGGVLYCVENKKELRFILLFLLFSIVFFCGCICIAGLL